VVEGQLSKFGIFVTIRRITIAYFSRLLKKCWFETVPDRPSCMPRQPSRDVPDLAPIVGLGLCFEDCVDISFMSFYRARRSPVTSAASTRIIGTIQLEDANLIRWTCHGLRKSCSDSRVPRRE